jgi:threonine dehydratase
MIGLAEVREARERAAGRLHVTPVVTATLLGRRMPGEPRLFIKCENLQKTGSFKSRGALNRIDRLSASERARGVVTVSAGNHAQGVAWAARAAGVRATVVMPSTASRAKVDASRGYGAEVVLHGASSIEALAKARELESEHGFVFVHPFDDPLVAAGAGTVALEFHEQMQAMGESLDVVVMPIGGGGLIGGMAAAFAELEPGLTMYGVEPEGAASMRGSLDAGHPITMRRVQTIADGLGAPSAGELAFEIVKRSVRDVIVIPDSAIANGVRELLLYTKLLAEPAGAAAVGALLAGAIPDVAGKRMGVVVSGGNVDLATLATLPT